MEFALRHHKLACEVERILAGQAVQSPQEAFDDEPAGSPAGRTTEVRNAVLTHLALDRSQPGQFKAKVSVEFDSEAHLERFIKALEMAA